MTQNEKFQIQRRNTLRNLWQRLSGTPDFPVKLALAALYLIGASYVCVKQAAWRTLAGNIPLLSPLLKAAMEHALPAYLLAGAAVAVVIGTLNGALIAWVGVSPILATLGTMTLISGLNILLSNGTVISGFPTAIQYLGNATIAGIPVALLLFFLVAILLWVLLEHTTLGRSLYLVGSNEQATRYSGVNTVRVQISVYVISALLGWVAAILMMAKFNSAKAGYGESYLLVTILASVLGGINPDGGFGRIIGLVLALIVLQMLESGLNLLGVSSYLTMALWGAVLILFIALQNRKA